MKAVVQKVSKAKVDVDGKTIAKIDRGLLVLLAITHSDDMNVVEWMGNKIANLRIFPDPDGKMNLSALDTGAEVLLVSNFTVYGDTQKGYRPSFSKAAPPDISEQIYNVMIKYMRRNFPLTIQYGEFGAMMDVELINDGPVTVILEKESNQ